MELGGDDRMATSAIFSCSDLRIRGHAPPDVGERPLLVDLEQPFAVESATSSRVVFEPMSMQARRT